jgi:hypothetical protein
MIILHIFSLASFLNFLYFWRDSSVVYSAGMVGDSNFGSGSEFFFSSPRPERLWGPPNLLSNEYQGLFTWEQSGRGVKLTTRLHLVQTSRMRGAIPPLPQYTSMAWCLVKEKAQEKLYILH